MSEQQANALEKGRPLDGQVAGNQTKQYWSGPTRFDIPSIVFTILLIAGGVFAFHSKGSSISLASSLVYGLLLIGAIIYESIKGSSTPLYIIYLSLGMLMIFRAFRSDSWWIPGIVAFFSNVMAVRHYLIVKEKKQRASV